jgi:hypothetical protein
MMVECLAARRASTDGVTAVTMAGMMESIQAEMMGEGPAASMARSMDA